MGPDSPYAVSSMKALKAAGPAIRIARGACSAGATAANEQAAAILSPYAPIAPLL
jgi:hypothetical protein